MEMSERLASIPDSYFGKTMGRIVEHGPLPLINMAVGIPDGETPRVLSIIFQRRYVFQKIKSMVHFTAKMPLNKLLLTSTKDITMLN